MLEIITFTQGPVDTHAYLVIDPESRQAVVIDPAWSGEHIAQESASRDCQITAIWVTHAHFDHIGGAADLVRRLNPPPAIALHPADLPLYQMQGGGPMFGVQIEQAPPPSVELYHGQVIEVGAYAFEVRHTPGHTPGSVIFYSNSESVAFCGDLIFRGGIGRTDIPGGSYETLMDSIQGQVLTLPDDTVLYSGHGPATKVGIEKINNPFL